MQLSLALNQSIPLTPLTHRLWWWQRKPASHQEGWLNAVSFNCMDHQRRKWNWFTIERMWEDLLSFCTIIFALKSSQLAEFCKQALRNVVLLSEMWSRYSIERMTMNNWSSFLWNTSTMCIDIQAYAYMQSYMSVQERLHGLRGFHGWNFH